MVQKVDSIIKLNLKTILEKVEERYGLKLSRKVVMVDYDEKLGSLFIKFKHSDIIDGKPTSDGLSPLRERRRINCNRNPRHNKNPTTNILALLCYAISPVDRLEKASLPVSPNRILDAGNIYLVYLMR